MVNPRRFSVASAAIQYSETTNKTVRHEPRIRRSNSQAKFDVVSGKPRTAAVRTKIATISSRLKPKIWISLGTAKAVTMAANAWAAVCKPIATPDAPERSSSIDSKGIIRAKPMPTIEMAAMIPARSRKSGRGGEVLKPHQTNREEQQKATDLT